jgi:hypothetical protein
MIGLRAIFVAVVLAVSILVSAFVVDNGTTGTMSLPYNVTTGNLLEKRMEHSSIECALPVHPDIVPVTPNLGNKGWANSYDRPCSA